MSDNQLSTASELYAIVYNKDYNNFLASLKSSAFNLIDAKFDSQCLYTGAFIAKGDQVVTNPFNGKLYIAEKAETFNIHAPYCSLEALYSTTIKPLREAAMSIAINKKGVIKIGKGVELAKVLFDPPPPPFSIMIGTAKQQHLLWRSPVNDDRDFFQVRVGDMLLTIDRERIIKHYATFVKLVKKYQIPARNETKELLGTPFLLRGVDSFKLKVSIGEIHPQLLKLASNEDIANFIKKITPLSLGDKWALTIFNYLKKEGK